MIHSSKKRVLLTAAAAILVIGSIYYFFQPQPTKPTQQAQAQSTKLALLPYPEQIKGEVITLHKMNPKYLRAFYQAFSENVRQGLDFPEKVSFFYVERYFNHLFSNIQQNKSINYHIFDNEDEKLVGSLEIREKNDSDPGQFGMWINEHYRGGGRMQEALLLISRAYFDIRKEHNKYNVHVRPWNYSSISAIEKFGFIKVGDYIENGKVTRFIYEIERGDIN